MRGSDPGGVTRTPPLSGGPWGRPVSTHEGRPRFRERVFRASLLSQFREGAWPFTLAVLAPTVGGMIVLFHRYLAGDDMQGLSTALSALVPILIAPLIAAILKGLKPEAERPATCAWVALGDGYIRLGMSFLRPKILLEQIVDVERGILWRGRWISEVEAAQADAPGSTGSVGGARWGRRAACPRVRVRLVMRRTWNVVAFAYPAAIDPMGELTTALALAGSRTRDRLRIPEGASHETATAAFRELAELYARRAASAAEAARATDQALFGPALGGRRWTLPAPDPLPEPEPIPAATHADLSPDAAPELPRASEYPPPPV